MVLKAVPVPNLRTHCFYLQPRMAHHAAKQSACANCYYAFAADQPDDYCPRCGQYNEVPDLRLGHVLEEALEGFSHFDGKVWQTLKLLLFRPGELTRRFLAGQRVGFVPPIRLYVLISFVFFFVLSLKQGSHSNKPMRREFAEKVRLAQATGKPERLDIFGISIDIRPDKSTSKADADTAGRLPINFSGIDKIKMPDLDKLPDEASSAQVDSLIKAKGEIPTFLTRLTVQRNLRWRNVSLGEIGHQVSRGLSLLVFLLMPLTALLLKLVYIRRGRYYLSHFIFTVHVHCFIFLLLLFGQLLALVVPQFPFGSWLALVMFVYFVLALRRVYEQGWLKTVSKSLLLSFSYLMLFLLVFAGVLVLGAAIF